MLNREQLLRDLGELPLYACEFIDPRQLEFSDKVRWICEHECPMYAKTWACPPAVGSVDACREKCRSYTGCLLIATVAEISDSPDLRQTLATRPQHERITNQVRDAMRGQGVWPYVLSAYACDLCSRCAWLDGLPCRLPGKMHPCVESHGILISAAAERVGLEILQTGNVVTWFSLLFYKE